MYIHALHIFPHVPLHWDMSYTWEYVFYKCIPCNEYEDEAFHIKEGDNVEAL